MKPSVLRLALVLSLLVNLGVIGVVGYRAIQVGGLPPLVGWQQTFPGLPRYLNLSEQQLRVWRQAEAAFLQQLGVGAAEIQARRDQMIREIFSPTPDLAAIEAERAGIARLQDDQQRLVISQLLRERDLLDPRQRELLAQLLLNQPVGPSAFERLHRD